MAFAPLGCNSFGQQPQEILRYKWIVTYQAAQRVVSTTHFSLPAAAESVQTSPSYLPGVVDGHNSLLKLHQHAPCAARPTSSCAEPLCCSLLTLPDVPVGVLEPWPGAVLVGVT